MDIDDKIFVYGKNSYEPDFLGEYVSLAEFLAATEEMASLIPEVDGDSGQLSLPW